MADRRQEVSEPDLFAKLSSFADISLQTLAFVVQETELSAQQLAACELLQVIAIATKRLATMEAERQARHRETRDDSTGESVRAADARHAAAHGR